MRVTKYTARHIRASMQTLIVLRDLTLVAYHGAAQTIDFAVTSVGFLSLEVFRHVPASNDAVYTLDRRMGK
jgi:hypothetical protein